MDPRLDRVLIVGNSGSGKSRLSGLLSGLLGCEGFDLDAIHWEPGGYDRPRDREDAITAVRRVAEKPSWIVEGVYGWLAAEASPRATTLVWLDLPVADCLANIEHRGMRRGATPASHTALLDWTAAYPNRQTSSSQSGHARLFDAFQADRFRLGSRIDIERWLDPVSRGAAP